jgi:hypothetical protein
MLWEIILQEHRAFFKPTSQEDLLMTERLHEKEEFS